MRKVLLSAATLCMSMLFGVSAFAADIDVTSKVGTSLDAWTCENGKKNSVTIDGIVMVENFQDGSTSTSASTTGVVLWQDVAGLDNGNYTVELWANARVAWQDSPATDGQDSLTYLVANNVEISMQVFLNPGLNNNATYVLEGVEVTDGTLHIEMNKKAAGSNWHSIQIKSLTYHASDNEALVAAKADLKAALDAAAAVEPASEALTAAIAVAQGVYDASSDIEEVKAAVAPLQAATAFAVNCNSVAGASVAAPVVTNFVVNGTFDTTTSPWKTTTGAQNQALASNQTGAFTGKFFENWNPSNYTGKIYQVIENIPNGLYELSICAFVNNFVAGANYVYANADKKELTTGAPTAYTVRTTVTDNVIEIGLEQVEAVNEWMGIDNVSLKYFGEVDENYAKDIYASTKAAAEALLTAKMSAEALATLEAALAVEVDETSDEALLAAEAALQEAIASVQASVNFYASNKAAIDAMFALMESTNVYTEEAYSTYAALAEEYLAKYEACELTTAVDNPFTVHGWHAEVAYDDLLLSAFGTNNFDTNLYINTWSTEGEGDGSEFKVPFFEYWTGDANSLEATTKTATVTGLIPGGVYSLEAWVRTRAKNGVDAAEATGITLNVGAGDTVDVTEGVVVGTSQFAHAVYTAVGQADAEGNLTINFNVLADNNVSWLSFKNLKYASNEAVNNFIAAYSSLELLTESCPSMWMISACNEKFNAIQEPAYAMKEAVMETPADTLVKYTAIITETVEFIMAMDAKYNAWKSQLMVAYDYQDNSTADSVARAAFDEVVDIHMGYQWMMPAASVAELDALIDELDEACIIYASQATANEGFDFGLMEVESPWVGVDVADSLKAYLYNTAANAFLAAGNSWGTQASFTETGIEWLVEGADKLYTLDGPISNGGAQHYFTGTYTDGAATQVRVRMVAANVFTLKVGDKYIAYDGTNIVANVAELSDACYWQFVTKAERQGKYASATAINAADATFEIAGANFGRNDGNNKAWAGSPAVGGENNNMCAEKWNAGIVTVSQVLTNMPSGVYRMSAQGFYRMGGMGEAATARTNGTEVLHAKFFANSDSIDVMSVLDCAGMLEGVGNSGYTGFGLAPNSMGEASKFFSAGLYEHTLVFEVAEGVDTIALGVTKTGSVGADWLIFDNFRLEYLGAKNDVDYMGSGILTSVSEGNHYVFYTDAEGNNHFLNAAGQNNWVVSADPVTIAFSNGNITDAFAGAASFMASNGFYMSNAANSDGSGAIKTEAITGSNGQNKRTWESQVFYKNAAGKYAIRLTNAIGTSWGANCFVNIDPATLAVVSGQPTLGDALYLWEIADEDDPRFSNKVVAALIEKAEAITAIYNKEVKAALDAVVAAAKVATPAEVMVIKAQLEEAIAAAQASVAEYEAIARQLAVSNSVLVSTAFGYDDFAAAVAAAEATYADSTATAEALTVLAEATASYLAANEVEGIVNGDFANGTTGWTGAMGTGNHNKWTNVNDQFVEKWTAAPGILADMDFYQEISGLPAGTYTFAAYVSACQQANDDSYEVTGVKLYANGDSVAVHTINIDRDAANKAIGAELVMVTTTIADGETLKIGMNIASTDANWVVMDNAKLYNFDNPCLKTYEVVLEDVKVADWTAATVISAEVMAEIVELLGAPASELTYQLVDTTGVHTNYNGNPGEVLFWVDLDGNASAWNVNNKFFLMYDSVAQTITSTQYAVAEGDVLNVTLRLANAEGKYVVIKLTESIFVSPVINIEDYEVVSTITVNHVEATGVTLSGNTASFDPISTAAALGVASLDEAEQYILNVTTGNLVANTTDGWRDANGDAAKWGTTGGVCVKIQKPSSGSIDYIGCYDTTHQHGEVYTAKWAFVHEGKAVVIEVVIVFETAGIENIETLDNAVIYTISGTRVQGDVKSLERGIYIVNGKKVFVK